MKKIIALTMGFLGLFGCNSQNKIEYFPQKKDVLITEYSDYTNFFPIGKINLKKFGIDKNIGLVYVFFDHEERGFQKGDDIDHFSYQIQNDGKLKPTFESISLNMTDSYGKYLTQSIDKYKDFKKKGNTKFLISFYEEPEWWQDDETPIQEDGNQMTFICQIDCYEFSEDDCRMFVFLDRKKEILRIIYQRT
jgi:hypothetical protein